MIPISDNQTASSARYEIDRALHDGQGWELLFEEQGAGPIGLQNFEFEITWGKLIFAWWNETESQSWRITGYEIDRAEIRLQARRGMGAQSSMLYLRDRDRWGELEAQKNLPPGERRKLYANTLIGLVAEKLENARFGTPATGAGSQRNVRGGYARFWARQRDKTILYIGAGQTESQTMIDGIVSAGLVWLESYNSTRPEKKWASRLAICVPAGRSRTVAERLTFLRKDAGAASPELPEPELYEMDEEAGALTPIRPYTQYELLNLHMPDLDWPGEASVHCRWKERILNLAPEQIEARLRSTLSLESVVGWSFSIHGLEFARSFGPGEQDVKFGIRALGSDHDGGQQTLLTESNFSDLAKLTDHLLEYRSPQTPDPRHPLYRMREEAWLESLLRRDIQILDASFDPGYVYSQAPAWRGDERSVIDLLGVDHQCRLAVIEIKASEDAELPMQGLDYWLRVEQARLRGEFPRRGLFRGLSLADQPPRLYLVAPRLRFHRSFLLTAQSLSSEIEIWQIGLNANWRQGVKIYSKCRL